MDIRLFVRAVFIFLIIFFISGYTETAAQEYNSIYPVSSIDPAETDFSDLEPLKEIIGDARVVFLGEQSHGEASTFDAKARLVKYLHEELGFNVLAWESGVYDCDVLWYTLQVPALAESPREVAQNAIFRIWTKSPDMDEIFDYLVEQLAEENPLYLCGFDDQFTGKYSEDHYVRELKRVLNEQRIQKPGKKERNDFANHLQKLISDYEYRPSPEEQEQFFSTLDFIVDTLSQSKTLKHDPMGEVILHTLRGAKSVAYRRFRNSSTTLRERQMAKNLMFNLQKYQNEKVIVWSSSFHILKNHDKIEGYDNIPTMGSFFQDMYEEKTVTIGAISYEGETYDHYTKQSAKLESPPDNSIEQWAHDFGEPYAIIDFSKWEDKGEPIYSRPLGNVDQKGYWWDCFDVMFFINESRAKKMVGW